MPRPMNERAGLHEEGVRNPIGYLSVLPADIDRRQRRGVFVSILWIVLIIVIVLALLGFLGRGAW
jgi:hypothetical protein